MSKDRGLFRKPFHELSREGKRLRLKVSEKDDDLATQLRRPDETANENNFGGNRPNDASGPSAVDHPSELIDRTEDTSSSEDQIYEKDDVSGSPNASHTYSLADEHCVIGFFDESSGGKTSSSDEDNSEVDSGHSNENTSMHDVSSLRAADSENLDELGNMKLFLKEWAIKNNIPISALSSLCVGLRNQHNTCFKNLPVDGRTILKTPTSINVQEMPPGQYIHIGLKNQLNMILTTIQHVEFTTLGIIFNIDGLPLYRSSPSELYPILFTIPTIEELSGKVFPIGLYYGEKKPEDLHSFLASFLMELIDVINNGVTVNNTHYNVNILAFCCDTPAKSFLLGTTSHNGFRSCTRCQVNGVTVEKRRVFLENNCEPRTHDDFIQRTDQVFQPRTTPLVEVPTLNFVNSFVLDYMHLICLGVMRTLLFIWTSGPLPLRLSKRQRDFFSENLAAFSKYVPDDFARKPRDLNQLKLWKAVEFRMFLLYFGPVILKSVLNDDKYRNFITLHIATNILLSTDKCSDSDMRNYAKELMIVFVESVRVLYGDMYITHNFHNLIHVTDDAEFFSSKIPNFNLHQISAFPFENYLQSIKRKVRGRAKPLQQIGKRLGEEFLLNEGMYRCSRPSGVVLPTYKGDHHSGPLLHSCTNPQYKKMQFKNFAISTYPPNNCCQLKDGTVCLTKNIAYCQESKEHVIVGHSLLKTEDLYGTPLYPSSKLGIMKGRKLSEMKKWPIRHIVTKCLCLKYEEKYFVFPLSHSDVGL